MRNGQPVIQWQQLTKQKPLQRRNSNCELIIQTRNNRMQLSDLAQQFLYFLYFKHADEVPSLVELGSMCTRNTSFQLQLGTWTSVMLLSTTVQKKISRLVISKQVVVGSNYGINCRPAEVTYILISIKQFSIYQFLQQTAQK